jgi:hypothetical protein
MMEYKEDSGRILEGWHTCDREQFPDCFTPPEHCHA